MNIKTRAAKITIATALAAGCCGAAVCVQAAAPSESGILQTAQAATMGNSFSCKYFKLTKGKAYYRYGSSWSVKKTGKRTWNVQVYYDEEGGGGIDVVVAKKAPKSMVCYYRVGKSKGYKVYLCRPAGGTAIGFKTKDYSSHKARLTKGSCLIMKIK